MPPDPPPSRAQGAAHVLHGVLARLVEPGVLFPGLALLLLAVIWGAMLQLAAAERAAAEQAAVASRDKLIETYEAQVVRALREIDQTLKVVQYAHPRSPGPGLLQALRAQGLLPPEQLFELRIVEGAGSAAPADGLRIERAASGAAGAGGQLRFSRRLERAGTSGESSQSAGSAVVLSVDAAYFVSGYDAARLGAQGVLGLRNQDGVFLVRRSGERVDTADTQAHPPIAGGTAPAVDAWDGVLRYTREQTLFDFSLAVVLGLSHDEQLAAARHNARSRAAWAAGASLVLVAGLAMLGRLSMQLARSRQRIVDAQVAHAAQVEYLAYHDALTGLPNRSLFSKLLGQGIQQAQRYAQPLAVLYLDLDRFKQINDTLGHEAGDQLLQEVATRLKASLRDSDVVARLGGDEFVVLLPRLEADNHAAAVAQKMLDAIARPFVLQGQECRVTGSIGISSCPKDGIDEQTLKRHADTAMYLAKELGKNNYQFYSDRLDKNSLERLALESGLRRALAEGEFELHYQAQCDIHSERITGMEALLRWRHPELGLTAPLRFIPLAEETGLILPIGRWVLRTACKQLMAWQRQGLPRLRVAVNLSARQFADPQLPAELRAALTESGLDATQLELEVSENVLLRDVESSLRVLAELKALGVRIAIDDFGVGYSSLSTLQRFPLDTIKIDRSYLRGPGRPGADRDLGDAIVAMGRSLSLTIVAQGVETQAQADSLPAGACDEVQGYFMHQPLPADELTGLLRAQVQAAPDLSTAA